MLSFFHNLKNQTENKIFLKRKKKRVNLGTFVVLGVPIQWVLFYFKNYKVRSSPENGGVSVGMGQSSRKGVK